MYSWCGVKAEPKAHPEITSRTLVGDAVQYMLDHPEVMQEYLAECAQHEWPEREFQTSPQWAEWFVRRCVVDCWPTAEPLLREDIERYSDYQRYVSLLRQLGMVGYSTGEHYFASLEPQDYEAEVWDVDKLAETVEWFRKQRAAGTGDDDI